MWPFRSKRTKEAAVPDAFENDPAKPVKVDPCADLREAKREADEAAAALINENERLRKIAASAKDDCGCGEHEACVAEAAAAFRNLAKAMRKAVNG